MAFAIRSKIPLKFVSALAAYAATLIAMLVSASLVGATTFGTTYTYPTPCRVGELADLSAPYCYAAGLRPALAVDGSAFTSVTAATAAVTLTTASTNDVIIVYAWTNAGPLLSVSDTAGLTWTRRVQFHTTGTIYLEEWYAIASPLLTGDVITGTATGASDYNLAAVAVKNANTSTPFDGTAVTNSVTNCKITTTNSDTLLLAAIGAGVANPTAGTGWTGIFTLDWEVVEDKLLSAPGTNVDVGVTGICIEDAVRQ